MWVSGKTDMLIFPFHYSGPPDDDVSYLLFLLDHRVDWQAIPFLWHLLKLLILPLVPLLSECLRNSLRKHKGIWESAEGKHESSIFPQTRGPLFNVYSEFLLITSSFILQPCLAAIRGTEIECRRMLDLETDLMPSNSYACILACTRVEAGDNYQVSFSITFHHILLRRISYGTRSSSLLLWAWPGNSRDLPVSAFLRGALRIQIQVLVSSAQASYPFSHCPSPGTIQLLLHGLHLYSAF